jgi:catechol 2,3-dioxygenase-like lactoylglutathione lyase family enzyme
MFDHVTIRAADAAASERFYATVLDGLPVGDRRTALRIEQAGSGGGTGDGVTRHLHVAFVTTAREQIDGFWRTGVAAGYESDGAPGPRTVYSETYYGGFLLDPDGNSAEAVHHGRERAHGSVIDHLWIGVADLDAALRFWETVAAPLGLTVYGNRPERFHVGARDRSFALVADGRPSTCNLEIGVQVESDDAARTMREAAAAAGWRADGDGVLDPDGTRVVPVVTR